MKIFKTKKTKNRAPVEGITSIAANGLASYFAFNLRASSFFSTSLRTHLLEEETLFCFVFLGRGQGTRCQTASSRGNGGGGRRHFHKPSPAERERACPGFVRHRTDPPLQGLRGILKKKKKILPPPWLLDVVLLVRTWCDAKTRARCLSKYGSDALASWGVFFSPLFHSHSAEQQATYHSPSPFGCRVSLFPNLFKVRVTQTYEKAAK